MEHSDTTKTNSLTYNEQQASLAACTGSMSRDLGMRVVLYKHVWVRIKALDFS